MLRHPSFVSLGAPADRAERLPGSARTVAFAPDFGDDLTREARCQHIKRPLRELQVTMPQRPGLGPSESGGDAQIRSCVDEAA